jgi:hypothetical protein
MLDTSRLESVREGSVFGLMDKWNSIPDMPYQMYALRAKFMDMFEKYILFMSLDDTDQDMDKERVYKLEIISGKLRDLVGEHLPNIVDTVLKRKGIAQLMRRGCSFEKVATATDKIKELNEMIHYQLPLSHTQTLEDIQAALRKECPDAYRFWIRVVSINWEDTDAVNFVFHTFREAGLSAYKNGERRKAFMAELATYNHNWITIQNYLIWARYHNGISPVDWVQTELNDTKTRVLVLEAKYEENEYVENNHRFYDFVPARTSGNAIKTLLSGMLEVGSMRPWDIVIAKEDTVTFEFINDVRKISQSIPIVIYSCDDIGMAKIYTEMGATLVTNSVHSILLGDSGWPVAFDLKTSTSQ